MITGGRGNSNFNSGNGLTKEQVDFLSNKAAFVKIEKRSNIYPKGIWGWDDWALLPDLDKKWTPEIEMEYRTPMYRRLIKPSKLFLVKHRGLSFFTIGATTKPYWCLCFNITKKRKNIFFTVSDMSGRVLVSVSAGLFNIPKRKRLSPQALEPLFEKIINCFLLKRVYNVIIRVKVRARYLYNHVVRLFKDNNIVVRLIYDCIPVPHNGIRAKKQRRL